MIKFLFGVRAERLAAKKAVSVAKTLNFREDHHRPGFFRI